MDNHMEWDMLLVAQWINVGRGSGGIWVIANEWSKDTQGVSCPRNPREGELSVITISYYTQPPLLLLRDRNSNKTLKPVERLQEKSGAFISLMCTICDAGVMIFLTQANWPVSALKPVNPPKMKAWLFHSVNVYTDISCFNIYCDLG